VSHSAPRQPPSNEARTILVCDDEELIRWSVAEQLQGAGYHTIEVGDGLACLEAVAQHAPAAVVLDLKMPGLDGLGVLKKLREGGSDVPVVVITAHGGVESAIVATRLGAGAYLEKPFDLREIVLAVGKVLDEDRLRQEVHLLRDRQRAGYGEFVGRSDALRPLFSDLQRLETVVAPTLLVLGESGSGKDVLARTIHARGPRKDRIFVEVDCASLPETLIESELFGYERGAFTDAKAQKRGLFEAATGGVVFLDEIGEISLGTQAKLLRALENRTFKRVGGLATIQLDAQVIAATNRDLKKEVEKGRFREDLYYRLNVVTLKIPPLRERRDDLPLLAGQFLERFNRTFGRHVRGFSGEAMAMLQAYDWPGNVRELKNLLERIVLLGTSELVGPDELPAEVRFSRVRELPAADGTLPFPLPADGVDLDQVERGFLVQALARTGGNQSAAARLLGISRYQLRYRCEKFDLAAR
jgi:two-component system, NtrC family, response regulator AtoC